MENNQSISTDVTTVLGEYLESLTEIDTAEAQKIAEKFLFQIKNKIQVNENLCFDSIKSISHDQPVYLNGIKFISLCEHHLMPFYGSVNLAIYPNNKIAGISKFSELILKLSNKLNLQETFGKEIVEVLSNSLDPKGVFVQITATHLCSDITDVRTASGEVVTTYSSGIYELDHTLRAEALSNFK